jgi:hypothetical protein
METIFNNLLDPSWWFTGLFFGALLYIIPTIFSRLQTLLRNSAKSFLLKRLKLIKKSRFNQSLVNYEITKAQSYFLIFIITSLFYLTWFVAGPLKAVADASPALAIILSAPIYIAEIIWLLHDSLAKELAISRGKVA